MTQPAADGIRCMLMRGGTSKGLYFLAADLPAAAGERDALLLRIMGSGHPLHVDGLGSGSTSIAGVPGSAAPITLRFANTAGSATGALLPTGSIRDTIDGIEVSCVDNGMPVVVARAGDLGITGYESPGDLAGDSGLRDRVQSLRLAAGKLMGLGDVSETSVPKTTLVSAPRDGGTICTRTFIPVRPHTAIGVLGAVSAATALLMPGGTGAELAAWPGSGHLIDVEHPTGHLLVDVELDTSVQPPLVRGAGVVRTARKLFDGTAYPVQQTGHIREGLQRAG